ncbi:hypothetical protein IGI04_007560 [Brassica rapa subsp. trilocularis]|uniref:Uncharacterized protein n=1 Tax=Brassica rapa subsp. trilocularis TaxID=1813537 RepID=A0ABQ7NK21_BRACM|nr:hypothetical protein IGI04_007560 [Brassica rapa subsp. trilocularis]
MCVTKRRKPRSHDRRETNGRNHSAKKRLHQPELKRRGIKAWKDGWRISRLRSIKISNQSYRLFMSEKNMDYQLYQEEDLCLVFDEEKDIGPIFDEEEDLGLIFDEDEDLGPIFDEEEEPKAVSVLLAVQKVAEDVVDSGPEADHEKDLTTAYASGDILGSLSSAKLVIFSVLYQVPNWFSHLFSRSTTQWSY